MLLLVLQGLTAQDLYVSPGGFDANSGLSVSEPMKTIQHAADLITPGDTVFIMDGTYASTYGPVLNIERSGHEESYITFKAYPNHNPVLFASGNVWNAVSINGNYIIIDGLEVMGNNQALGYDDAYASYESYIEGNRDWEKFAGFNASGISVGGANDQSKYPHHVLIRNCEVHDFPGGGVSVMQADYTTIESNTVYNNSWYCMYANSGISIIHPVNSDSIAGIYKMIVANNTAFNNKTLVPWISTRDLSDGNGIIIDINKYPWGYPDSLNAGYLGKTLVKNNISYCNGGSGMHAYHADNVDIINNTAYNNGQQVGYAEIFSNQCSNNRVVNNIMYARTGGKVNSDYKNEQTDYDYNVYYNGPAEAFGQNDIIADPKFIEPGCDVNADFQLRPGSPAINSGSAEPGTYSEKDISGTERPRGNGPDRGAYEFIPGNEPQEISFDPLPESEIGDPDFDGGATASSGLEVLYRSSDHEVARILNNRIQLRGVGEAVITAAQPGNEVFAPAGDKEQLLTVSGEAHQNLITNATFNDNTNGWHLSLSNSADAQLKLSERDGLSGNTLMTDILNGGLENPWDMQLSAAAPVYEGKKYNVSFKIVTDSSCSIDVALQSDHAPWTIHHAEWGLNIDSSVYDHSFSFTAGETDASTLLKFLLGKCKSPVYIDDIEVISPPTPKMEILKDGSTLQNYTWSYNFGEIFTDSSSEVILKIQNSGEITLNLLYREKVIIESEDFFLSDLPSTSINPGQSLPFSIDFSPSDTGKYESRVSIATDDPIHSLFEFNLLGRAIEDTSSIINVPVLYEDQLLLFPNPCSGIFFIRSDREIETIRLFDHTGRYIREFRHVIDRLDLTGLAPGVYFLNIVQKDRVIGRSVMIK